MKDCTLILTEGDSAKALAVAGLAVLGRDKFGVLCSVVGSCMQLSCDCSESSWWLKSQLDTDRPRKISPEFNAPLGLASSCSMPFALFFNGFLLLNM